MLLRGIYLHHYRSLILIAGKTFLLAAQKSNLHNLFTQLLVSNTVLSILIVPNLQSHCMLTIFIAPCMPLWREHTPTDLLIMKKNHAHCFPDWLTNLSNILRTK
jgi:hypothetical protein